MDIDNFEKILNADKETEHLEFKEAKFQFNFNNGTHSILGYCTALANELGGKLILGVSDKVPRQVVGTQAFKDIIKLQKNIYNNLNRRINVEELYYENKRVLIFDIPSRPLGDVIFYKGMALMRIGESIKPMTSEQIKRVQKEVVGDYSATKIKEAIFDDLSTDAILELRNLLKQSGRVDKDIDKFDDEQLLIDLGLIDSKEEITVAALVLLGKERSLKKYLPYVEIRFGYKNDESDIRNLDTQIYSSGYLLFYNTIVEKIKARNNSIHINFGLRLLEKKIFDIESIRESINNAIIHRDYSENDTIIIIQTQTRFFVNSPGGFLQGVTPENIIDQTKTRNKLIADVLFKCEFVEQFGNGVNLITKNQLSLGKNPPDYNKSDNYHVILDIDGTIKDEEFAKYVIRVASESNKILNEKELVILNKIKSNEKVENCSIIKELEDLELIERVNKNNFILSKKYYEDMNKKGEYTRLKGLSKDENKMLLLKHLEIYSKGYMEEFKQVLNNCSIKTIQYYLQELKNEEKIELVGNPKITVGKNRAYWILNK